MDGESEEGARDGEIKGYRESFGGREIEGHRMEGSCGIGEGA